MPVGYLQSVDLETTENKSACGKVAEASTRELEITKQTL